MRERRLQHARPGILFSRALRLCSNPDDCTNEFLLGYVFVVVTMTGLSSATA